MIKKLLSGVAVFAAAFSFAQSGKQVVDIGVRETLSSNTGYAKTSALPLQCDTLYNFNAFAPTTTITIYTIPGSACSPSSTIPGYGGYVAGNNCYGDAAKATYYAGSTYSALNSPSVTGCFVVMYKNPTTGRGTTGAPTNTMGINIYNGTMAGGPSPTTAIGGTSATMGQVLTAFTATSTIGVIPFAFTTPVAISGSGFFTSVELPTVLGDTAVIYQMFQATTTSGWEKDATGSWWEMKTNWGGTINFELAIWPILGCSSVTGLTENELSNFFQVVPNPSNGVFTLVSTLSNLSYDVNVTNSLGQVIISKKGINGAAVNELNLTEYNSGVYFVNITSGNNTITKKLILNK